MYINTPESSKRKHKSEHKSKKPKPNPFGNEDGVANVTPVAVTVGLKKVKEKKQGVVKVSKHFKKEVEAALEKDKYHGHKMDIYYAVMPPFVYNQQVVDGQTYITAPYSKWSFLPEYFIDAASVLFNGKTATASTWTFASATNLGYAAPPASAGSNASAVKFKIIDSHEIFLWKNLSQRTIVLKLYEVAPKKASPLVQSGPGIVAGPFVVSDALQDPKTYWHNSLVDENSNGVNIQYTVETFVGNDPKFCPAFNEVYKSGTTEIILEPGASLRYKLQGPNNMDIDTSKFFNEQVFEGIQKWSRYVMPIIIPDLAVSTLQADTSYFGRMPDKDDGLNRNESIGFERKMYCNIEMPEQTGWKTPAAFAASTNTSLGNRRRGYAFTNWSQSTPVGPFEDITKASGNIAAFN